MNIIYRLQMIFIYRLIHLYNIPDKLKSIHEEYKNIYNLDMIIK